MTLYTKVKCWASTTVWVRSTRTFKLHWLLSLCKSWVCGRTATRTWLLNLRRPAARMLLESRRSDQRSDNLKVTCLRSVSSSICTQLWLKRTTACGPFAPRTPSESTSKLHHLYFSLFSLSNFFSALLQISHSVRRTARFSKFGWKHKKLRKTNFKRFDLRLLLSSMIRAKSLARRICI